MNNTYVIGVEEPEFYTSETININSIIIKEDELYLLNSFGELLKLGHYYDYIDTIDYLVGEGSYNYTFFKLNERKVITDEGDELHDYYKKVKDINMTVLKIFNDFLITCNQDNKEMVDSLRQSLHNGIFKEEVLDIIKDDEVDILSKIDRKIIARCNIEGIKYIKDFTKKTLAKEYTHNLQDINYFYRRLFNLEMCNLISFNNKLLRG